MTIQEQIEHYEKELERLKEKARIEREKEQYKIDAAHDSDLLAIMEQVTDFNKKYNEHITIAVDKNSLSGRTIWDTYFPWI